MINLSEVLKDKLVNGRYGWREIERRWYIGKKRRRLKNKDFTILATNCCGTMMYHDLGLPFLSPTINLMIGMSDFFKLLGNLKWYMEQEIVEQQSDYQFPVGLLADITIKFMHYDTFDDAVTKWEERKKRINWDNLFIVATDRDGCSYETLKRFDQLPYKNKVIFTHIDYPEILSAYHIKGFEDREEVGTLTNYKDQLLKRRYIDDFDYVSFLNGER